jgi:hypothetical protein
MTGNVLNNAVMVLIAVLLATTYWVRILLAALAVIYIISQPSLTLYNARKIPNLHSLRQSYTFIRS